MNWNGVERRRYMPNGFKPQTAFEGYVVAKLEEMTNRLNYLPCDKNEIRLSICENSISNIQGKASMLGAISGLITYLIGKVLGK